MTEADVYSLYKGVYMPNLATTPKALKYFEQFCFRPDDILIVTYPKSGTTWMQQLVPLIVNRGDPDCVDKVLSFVRVPWLGTSRGKFDINLDERPSPRIMASHFQHSMMPKGYHDVKPKIIYVMRDPKDVFTSLFHFQKMASFLIPPTSKSEFLHKFLEGKVMFGSWFDHVKGWINAQDNDRILYIFYEEMIEDLQGSVKKLSKFLDISLDDEVTEQISDRCLFKNMKNNKMSNQTLVPSVFLDQTKGTFMRKGIVGDWKNLLTVEEAEHFDAVYEENMKDVDFQMYFNEATK